MLRPRATARALTSAVSVDRKLATIRSTSSGAVARGRELFFDRAQGCATCHSSGTGVDGQRHDVGSQAKADSANQFDTPSLKFVRGTAPYRNHALAVLARRALTWAWAEA